MNDCFLYSVNANYLVRSFFFVCVLYFSLSPALLRATHPPRGSLRYFRYNKKANDGYQRKLHATLNCLNFISADPEERKEKLDALTSLKSSSQHATVPADYR